MGPDEFHETYPGTEEGGLKNNAYTIEQKEEMAADKNANYVKLLEDLTPDDLLLA